MLKANLLITLATGVAVVVLIILPAAAIAVLLGEDTPQAPAVEQAMTSESPDGAAVTETVPEMTQRRMQVHAETGPPEGFEPMQQRLHASERQQGTGQLGQAAGRGPGWGRGDGHGGQNGSSQNASGMGNGRGMGYFEEPGWLAEGR